MCHGGAPKGVGPNPEKSGAPSNGARTPKGGSPKGGWAQNFALFFSSPALNFVLFVSHCVSSRGILVVFEALGPSNVHVWSSQVVV